MTNKTQLLALADKVELLEGGCRETDAEIFNACPHLHYPSSMVAYENIYNARHLPRWRCRFVDSEPKETDEALPRFLSSIDAAMTLVPEGWGFSISDRVPEPFKCRAWLHNNQHHFDGLSCSPNPDYRSSEVVAKTPALAIVAASLRALGDSDES